jgi:hypothetical protein
VASLGLVPVQGSTPDAIAHEQRQRQPQLIGDDYRPAPAACDRATSSYDALERIPCAPSTIGRCARSSSGYLRVGVRGSFLLGANNP